MAQPADHPIKASCHCGAITVTAPRLPEYVNVDGCTLCRRYAAAWAYYKASEVKIETKPGAVIKKYIWGDCDHSFNHCDNCGCVVYWWPLQEWPLPEGKDRMGLNTNNVHPDELRYVERRHTFDALWAPIENKEKRHPEDIAKYD